MFRRLKSIEVQVFLLLLLSTLPVSLQMLGAYLSFDDLKNISDYVRRPGEALTSNLVLFTSFKRPLGAVFYLPLYRLFGLDPFPYYLTGCLLFSLNLGLLYLLVLQLSKSRWLSLASTALFAFHPYVHTVLFNFGTVYEMTALAGCLAALLCYHRFARNPQRRWGWYLAAFGFFWLALNGKETAVVLPGLILGYELLYRILWRPSAERTSWLGLVMRLTPFGLVAMFYTLAKMLGREAFWRGNPEYEYHFDLRALERMFGYLDYYVYFVELSALAWIALLGAVAAAAFLTRNRHALFGLGFGLLTLAPVLPMDRSWALFIYLPSAGFGLALSAIAIEGAGRLWRRLDRPALAGWARRPWAQLALTALFLAAIAPMGYKPVTQIRRLYEQVRWEPWKSFAHQLWEKAPGLSEGSVVGLIDSPFDTSNYEFYCPHFLAWLKYGSHYIHIYHIPLQKEQFRQAVRFSRDVHLFEWKDGSLNEFDWKCFLQEEHAPCK